MSIDILQVVQNYLKINHPHLSGANIHLDTQNGAHDLQFAESPLLPNVDQAHVNENDYQVATITGNVEVEGGVSIPKILKLTVKDGTVQKELQSK